MVLALIFYYMRNRTDQLLFEQKLFIALLAAVALILILDALMWALDGVPGTNYGHIYAFITMFYYILNPVICLIWFFYVEFYIHKKKSYLKKIFIPMIIPALINLVLSVASLFGNVLFYIDSNNVYHRGRFFIVLAVISFYYLAHTLVLAIFHQKFIKKQDFFPIIFFVIPPVIGGIVQTLYYGLSLIWPFATTSILVIFITLQNHQLFTDHLTGLFNRRQLDRYLKNKFQNNDGTLLGGLMIDVDSFKNINDVHGHSVGDQALKDTSDILKKTFRKNDFVARYGGDEFIVVIAIQDEGDLQNAVERLQNNVKYFNNRKTAPYTISLSIGSDFYVDQEGDNVKDFITHLDELMYRNKQEREVRQVDIN